MSCIRPFPISSLQYSAEPAAEPGSLVACSVPQRSVHAHATDGDAASCSGTGVCAQQAVVIRPIRYTLYSHTKWLPSSKQQLNNDVEEADLVDNACLQADRKMLTTAY